MSVIGILRQLKANSGNRTLPQSPVPLFTTGANLPPKNSPRFFLGADFLSRPTILSLLVNPVIANCPLGWSHSLEPAAGFGVGRTSRPDYFSCRGIKASRKNQRCSLWEGFSAVLPRVAGTCITSLCFSRTCAAKALLIERSALGSNVSPQKEQAFFLSRSIRNGEAILGTCERIDHISPSRAFKRQGLPAPIPTVLM